jgi:ubiquinone/menaquinone biosynthesis C-methylase UbiE
MSDRGGVQDTLLCSEIARSTRLVHSAEDAKLYDPTIRFLSPVYDLLHDVVVAAVIGRTLDVAATNVVNVLDVGCGTGEEALRIAERAKTS